MNEQTRPEQWGWREEVSRKVIQFVGPQKFVSPYGPTPDNITSLKPIAMLAAIVLAAAGYDIKLILVCITVAVLSDMFDGPVARVLLFLGLTPPPIFLSKWLPFLKGGTYDSCTDKPAMFAGLSIVVARGYPIKPVLLLYFWIVVKMMASCHGGWLTGLDYRDLGRLVIRRQPSVGFRERLTTYLGTMTDPVYIGKIELNIQLAGLLTGCAWLIWPYAWLVKLGWFVGFLAIAAGYASYSEHIRRYLKHHGATFRPGSYLCDTWLPLADCERNRMALPRLLTNILMGLALYRVKKPT